MEMKLTGKLLLPPEKGKLKLLVRKPVPEFVESEEDPENRSYERLRRMIAIRMGEALPIRLDKGDLLVKIKLPRGRARCFSRELLELPREEWRNLLVQARVKVKTFHFFSKRREDSGREVQGCSFLLLSLVPLRASAKR